MAFTPRLAPYSILFKVEADPAADVTQQLLRFPTAGKFLAAYGTNDAAIATATNTVAVFLEKRSSAASPALQGTLASFAAGSTWAADVPRTATTTSFGSTALFAAGEHIWYKYDEVTTGVLTRAVFQIDYMLGYDTGETPTAATPPS